MKFTFLTIWSIFFRNSPGSYIANSITCFLTFYGNKGPNSTLQVANFITLDFTKKLVLNKLGIIKSK